MGWHGGAEAAYPRGTPLNAPPRVPALSRLGTYRTDRSYAWNYEHGPIWAGPMPVVPETPSKHFFGLEVASRIGISAGLLLNARWIGLYARCGYDILTYKTVRSRQRVCHPMPNWLFVDAADAEDLNRTSRAVHALGIIMNGVTGRMGTNQHLVRSILAIREQGGVALERRPRDARPDPGRPQRREGRRAGQGARHRALDDRPRRRAGQPRRHGVLRRRVHADARRPAQPRRSRRQAHLLRKADLGTLERRWIATGREAAGIKHGVVQDKLFLPGLLKLKMLIDSGFFGRILSVRGEFGYWVFEGDWQPAQRPSWNYRKADGGGIILDMLCHWRYVLDNLFGEVKAVSCLGATHIPQRWDENGPPYTADADDAAYATFELEGGVSRRSTVLGHARAARRPRHLPCRRHARLGGRRVHACYTSIARQHAQAGVEPRRAADHRSSSTLAGSARQHAYDNGFKVQWELFIRHVAVDGAPFPGTCWKAPRACSSPSSAAELEERRWIDVPALKV
jgi:predicted dehydrogenase